MAIDDRLKLSSDGIDRVGPGTATPADDVWALGMTLVEVLTQRPRREFDRREAIPRCLETLPGEFREIARNTLRRDPRNRRDGGRAATAAARRNGQTAKTSLGGGTCGRVRSDSAGDGGGNVAASQGGRT